MNNKIGLALAAMSIFGLIGMVGAQSTASIAASADVEAPVCAIGVWPGNYVVDGVGQSSAAVNFGTLAAGQTVTPGGADSQYVTVYNESTALVTALGTIPVTTGVTISGSDWTGAGWGAGTVGATTVYLTAWDSAASNGYQTPFAMPATQSGLILDMGPTGSGYGTLAFGLTVPSGTSGAATQNIIVSSAC